MSGGAAARTCAIGATLARGGRTCGLECGAQRQQVLGDRGARADLELDVSEDAGVLAGVPERTAGTGAALHPTKRRVEDAPAHVPLTTRTGQCARCATRSLTLPSACRPFRPRLPTTTRSAHSDRTVSSSTGLPSSSSTSARSEERRVGNDGERWR